MKVEILQTIPVVGGEHLKPGMIVDVVDPPKGENTSRGVWVVGERKTPILLLREKPQEYRVVFEEKNKPPITKVLAIGRMKKIATELFDEIDLRIRDLEAEYGAGRFDYDIEEYIDLHSNDPEFSVEGLLGNGRYLKFEIKDNLAALKAGEQVWKSVPFKGLSFNVQFLKRCPQSLK